MINKILAILLLAFSGSAYGEVLRCKGEFTSIETKYPIQLDIVLPESYRLSAWITTFSGEPKGIVIPRLGEGIIEVDTGFTKRFKFFVTRQPDDSENSLVGFYYEESYIQTVRVDIWKKDKPFFYYESFRNQLITGNCE